MKAELMCLSFLRAVSASAAELAVRSSAFSSGSTNAAKYVANGFGVPEEMCLPRFSGKTLQRGAKFFAITMFDPDASTGSGANALIGNDSTLAV